MRKRLKLSLAEILSRDQIRLLVRSLTETVTLVRSDSKQLIMISI